MEKVSLVNYREDNLSELKITPIAQTFVIHTPYLNFNKHALNFLTQIAGLFTIIALKYF